MTKRRLDPDVRSAQILSAAVTLAKRRGFSRLTRDAIAEEAGVSVGLVSNYLGTMDDLRNEVMRRAVVEEILPIIAAGLAEGNRIALRAPASLRHRAGTVLGR